MDKYNCVARRQKKIILPISAMMFNATFNNISIIS